MAAQAINNAALTNASRTDAGVGPAAANSLASNTQSNNSVGTGNSVGVADNRADAPKGKAVATDWGPLVALMAIIALCGWLGGHGARLMAEEAPPAGGTAAPASRYYILGIIAAACVPLFLSLTQSTLIKEILSRKQDEWLEAVLVVAGLCLIAAVSARAFLDSLSKRVLRDLDERVSEAQKDAKAAQTKAAAAARTAHAAAEVVDEQEARPQTNSQEGLESVNASGVELDEEQRALLALVAGKTFRSVGSLALESRLPHAHIVDLLGELEAKGLVETSNSPRTGSARWMATPLGLAALYG